MSSKKGRKIGKKHSKNRQQGQSSTSLFKQSRILISLFFLTLVTFFVYRGALDNDFVDWDDFTYVINNDLVRSVQDMEPQSSVQTNRTSPRPYNTTVGELFRRSVSSNYHPLTVLTMRWNNNVCQDCTYGISARPFILWNIILHIFNTLLVFFLVMQLSRNHLLASLAIAAIFALHPMHVESVAWVSERKDVLYSFFFISGLLSYLHFLKNKQNLWWIVTFALFILSCLSKGMAVVFPLVMLLLHWYTQTEGHSFKSLFKSLETNCVVACITIFHRIVNFWYARIQYSKWEITSSVY